MSFYKRVALIAKLEALHSIIALCLGLKEARTLSTKKASFSIKKA
jgi:hypothetical protein